MKKSLYLSFSAILITPYLAYLAMQAISSSDPDFVYVNEPSLFAAKWEKVASSNEFTEYLDPTRIDKNIDETVEIISMRNYFKKQFEIDSDKKSAYKSHVTHETIDCFNQTITVNKIYHLSDHFAGGSLVEDPIEPLSHPIKVNARSVGFSKIRVVCALANRNSDQQYIKSNFMNNI